MDADHLTAAIGFDATEGPRDLAHLQHGGHRHFLTETPVAEELSWVVNQELGDAIGMVHASDSRDQPAGRQRREYFLPLGSPSVRSCGATWRSSPIPKPLLGPSTTTAM